LAIEKIICESALPVVVGVCSFNSILSKELKQIKNIIYKNNAKIAATIPVKT